MSNHVQCPQCRHEFSVESVLAQRIEAEQKALFATRMREVEEREQRLNQEKAGLQSQLDTLLVQEKAKLTQQLKTQLRGEAEAERLSLQKELEEKSKLVISLRKQEAEVLCQQRLLEETKAGLDAEVEKRVAVERSHMVDQLRSKMEIENALVVKQKDELIRQLNQRVEEMKQKVEQGSMQAQGEAQELVIEDILRAAHPFDAFEEIKKGERGADLLQSVRNSAGLVCGSILYESKNTKEFSDTWVTKLKEDMLFKKADLGVIVTKALPKGVNCFDQYDQNIWVCSYEHFKALTFVLRAALLRVDEVRVIQANHGDKSRMLYDYLVGNAFKHQLKVVHDTFFGLQDALVKEKRSALNNFAKREKALDQILVNLVSIANGINTISGQTIAEFAEFEVVDEELGLLE